VLFLSHELIEQFVASVSEELPGMDLLGLLLILELDLSFLEMRLLRVFALLSCFGVLDLATVLLLPVLILGVMLPILQEPDSIEIVELSADELEPASQLDLDLAEHWLVLIDSLDTKLLALLLVTGLVLDVLPGRKVAAAGLNPPLYLELVFVTQLQSASRKSLALLHCRLVVLWRLRGLIWLLL